MSEFLQCCPLQALGINSFIVRCHVTMNCHGKMPVTYINNNNYLPSEVEWYNVCVFLSFLLQKWRAMSSFQRSLIILLCILACLTFLIWRKGLMSLSYSAEDLDEAGEHKGHKISDEHSPKFNRVNKQEISLNWPKLCLAITLFLWFGIIFSTILCYNFRQFFLYLP